MQWRMLQQDQPEDFVIATGRQESVRHFIELTASALGWGKLQWEGEGLDEVGRRSDKNGAVVVRIDPRYFRPAEVETLLGDPTSSKSLGDAKHQPGGDGERNDQLRQRGKREKRPT